MFTEAVILVIHYYCVIRVFITINNYNEKLYMEKYIII